MHTATATTPEVLLDLVSRSAEFARAAFPTDVEQRATSFVAHLAGGLFSYNETASDLVFDLLYNRIALPAPATAPTEGA